MEKTAQQPIVVVEAPQKKRQTSSCVRFLLFILLVSLVTFNFYPQLKAFCAHNFEEVVDEPVENKKQDPYVVDLDNQYFYTNGANRRPTDPATQEEIEAALRLLFPEQGIKSIEQADALLADENSWGSINNFLSKSEKMEIDPLLFDGANSMESPMSEEDAQRLFLEHYRECESVTETYEWVKANPDVRASLRWNSVRATASVVFDKDMVIKAQEDLENNVRPSWRKYVGVNVNTGISDIKSDGEAWRIQAAVIVDVTDPTNPTLIPEKTDVTYDFMRNINSVIPDYAPLQPQDIAYFIGFAQSLYQTTVAPRIYLPYYLTTQYNFNGRTRSWNGDLKFFVEPYTYLDGEDATLYGADRNDMIMTAHLLEYTESVRPLDAHNVMGAMVFPSALSFVYSANYDMIDPHNGLEDTATIALTWYGRGLEFTAEEARIVKAAIEYDSPEECNDMRMMNHRMESVTNPTSSSHGVYEQMKACVTLKETTDFTAVRMVITDAINRAWGDEELMGMFPGVLVTREADGAMVPKPVVQHPFDAATYMNHATASVVEEAVGKTHDIRSNIPEMRPLVDANGSPLIPPVGKHLENIAFDGPSFTQDGYGVEWDIGLKWYFQIGHLDGAGLTLFNIRLRLPPSAAFPEGELIPYIWKLNIPDFGTTYSGSSVGNMYQAAFLESHYRDGIGMVPSANCRGPHVTLPIFRSRDILNTAGYERPIYYSTYGMEGYNDPIAQAVLGVEWPFNSFPLERFSVNNGFIEHAICIQEEDYEQSMWHLYTSQSKRSLAVFSGAITEAYNVVNRFQFDSDMKIKVSERLHGKPAVMAHGVTGAGGAYSGNGRGAFAANHIHWHVVGIEPHLKKEAGNGVKNAVRVVDLALGPEDHTNWFGIAQHRLHTNIENTGDAELMKYDWMKQRFWEIYATDAEGEHLGGMKFYSQMMGPPMFTDMNQAPLRFSETNFEEGDTHLNHWWLQRNIWVANSEEAPSRQTLLAKSRTPDCRVGFTTHRCVEDAAIEDSPVVYVLMHVYHGVVSEEMPVQNGFTNVEMEIHPHNLIGFNPSILVRQTPDHQHTVQNSYLASERVFDLPYDTEWRE